MKKKELQQFMQQRRPEEIEPSAAVKEKLDKALKSKKQPAGFRLSLYPSIAAAVVFLIAGFGIGQFFDKPESVVPRTIQIVKYVDRPVKEIQYIQVPVKVEPTLAPASSKDSVSKLLSRENDLAMAEVIKVQKELSGISIGDDSVLQKMLVTIY